MWSYRGPVEVLVDDEVVARCHADLVAHEQRAASLGDGPRRQVWWRGRLSGSIDLYGLMAMREAVTLRTADGRSGEAVLRNQHGDVDGTGPPPFDI